MKNILALIILLPGLLAGFSQRAYAVKAYPYSIKITQPDGSVITIQKHGDEFLNWTTSGGRLVTQGVDGFITRPNSLPGELSRPLQTVCGRQPPRKVFPP